MKNKKVVISGSKSLYVEAKYWKKKFEDMGYTVLNYPHECDGNLEEAYKKRGKDPTIYDVITTWVNSLTKYYGIMATIYGCTWLFYKIQMWLFNFDYRRNYINSTGGAI